MASRPAPSAFVPSGIGDLDEILGGVLTGDNVVWVTDEHDLFVRVERSFLGAPAPTEGAPVAKPKALHVTARETEARARTSLGEDITVIDARPGSHFSDPVVLEQTIVATVKGGARRVVIDGLAPFATQWGPERAVAFFKRVCPRLFDLGAIAYWRVSRTKLGNSAIDEIRKVTQCVFELSNTQLRIIKAEGHSSLVQGRLFRVSVDDDGIHLRAERALGRLAEGLRTLRAERSLSQADIARLADVSASSISQAEGGRRGLSLDTLLTLTSNLGIGLDSLLENEDRPDYLLARRDRGTELGDSRFLLDDPGAGMRVYLVNLDPGEVGTPPVKHKGSELVLVARGLVIVDLGDSSPAMRAGDAILAARVPIVSWRNLSPDASYLFWILRD
ncbi:MAG: helix-turn-helix domain-containing protein [Actinomycetota bacterium]